MKKISDLILYRDHHLIVFNKPAGIPSQEDPTGDPSLHRMAMAYAHRDLHLIHRLDRRVSGIMVLAKTPQVAAHLSKQWQEHTVTKYYLAIVEKPHKLHREGTLTHYLSFDSKQNTTQVSDEPGEGREEAVLHYTHVHALDNFDVLRVQLIHGRKHQIRAQLAHMEAPVRGDIKYGSKRTNPDRAIDLHAYELELMHPTRHERMKITAPLPEGGLWEKIEWSPSKI